MLREANVRITKREWEILDFVVKGKTNKEIAAALGISDFTVRDHVSSLLCRAGVRNRAELVSWLFKNAQRSGAAV